MVYYSNVLEVIQTHAADPVVQGHGRRADHVAGENGVSQSRRQHERPVVLRMIEDAERRGLLRSGGTIIEATAGNTGAGWPWWRRSKGIAAFSCYPTK